ncbi:MAG TPA: hypothetical protein VL728_18640 [Cyclobacteriaceae bacterium]|jgi:hypothetical protein|nr:hypothetical protein [Cyclobacteriaceae bacterium]
MKIAKMIISVVCIAGTIAIIVYDAQSDKKHVLDSKQQASKADSSRQQNLPK